MKHSNKKQKLKDSVMKRIMFNKTKLHIPNSHNKRSKNRRNNKIRKSIDEGDISMINSDQKRDTIPHKVDKKCKSENENEIPSEIKGGVISNIKYPKEENEHKSFLQTKNEESKREKIENLANINHDQKSQNIYMMIKRKGSMNGYARKMQAIAHNNEKCVLNNSLDGKKKNDMSLVLKKEGDMQLRKIRSNEIIKCDVKTFKSEIQNKKIKKLDINSNKLKPYGTLNMKPFKDTDLKILPEPSQKRGAEGGTKYIRLPRGGEHCSNLTRKNYPEENRALDTKEKPLYNPQLQKYKFTEYVYDKEGVVRKSVNISFEEEKIAVFGFLQLIEDMKRKKGR